MCAKSPQRRSHQVSESLKEMQKHRQRSPRRAARRPLRGRRFATALFPQTKPPRQSLRCRRRGTTFGRRKREPLLSVRQPDNSGGQAAPCQRAEDRHLCFHPVLQTRSPRAVVARRARRRRKRLGTTLPARSFAAAGTGRPPSGRGVHRPSPRSPRPRHYSSAPREVVPSARRETARGEKPGRRDASAETRIPRSRARRPPAAQPVLVAGAPGLSLESRRPWRPAAGGAARPKT
uniref:Uncharacterized protein LOC117310550 n=1 Tax=Tursiops truncatus TaxID=9739 RepID=A0A6J3QV15_TURTR|nr:uncharacterized protein LOC117310550 [Tursiops truncatus]